MSRTTRWAVIISAGVLIGLAILVVMVLVFNTITGLFFGRPFGRPFSRPFGIRPDTFDSNGERLYFTATSNSNEPIRAEMPGMHQMPPGVIACVDCHGPSGQGGTVRWMMMGTFTAPDIRWKTLSQEEHAEEGEEHPPYTVETIKRAITEGINPAGEPLEFPMPRWQMSEQDLDDLVEFLITLE